MAVKSALAGATQAAPPLGPTPADASVGHVHLRVSDLERAARFYCDVLGCTVTFDGRSIGMPVVFLAFRSYHHHFALNTWMSAGGDPPPPGCTGLHHVALRYASRAELARATGRVLTHGWPIASAEDHGVTVSVYLADSDGNGLELYYDRPREEWFDEHGLPVLKAEPVDVRELAAEARPAAAS